MEGIRSGDSIADYVITHALRPRHELVTVIPSMDPEAQIALAVSLEDVAAHGGLPRPPASPASGGSPGPAGTHPGEWFQGNFEHQTGAGSPGTTDGRPLDSSFRTQPLGGTSTADTTSAQGTAALLSNLIGYLDGGDANHDGLALVVNLNSSSPDLFKVF